MWGLNGADTLPTVESWDAKSAPLVEALLAIVSTGCTVYMRSGSGGRAIGLAIWEADTRGDTKWVYDAEELDMWAAQVLAIRNKRNASSTE
jgi:hypothetical protein